MKALRSPLKVSVTANGVKTLDSMGHPNAMHWKIERTGLGALEITPIRENGLAWEHDLWVIQSNEAGGWFDLDGIDSFTLNNQGSMPTTVTITPYR